MKLRNKKTDEIIDLSDRGLLKSSYDGSHIIIYPRGVQKYCMYNSLAELNAEWEDAEQIDRRKRSTEERLLNLEIKMADAEDDISMLIDKIFKL